MKIFLSHSSRDKALVREIRSHLPKHIDSWLDEDKLLIGKDLRVSIRTAIQKDTDFVVIFLGREAISSQWVRKELEWALEREQTIGRTFILPILLDDVWDQVEPEEFRNRLYLRCVDQSAIAVKAVSQQLAEQIFARLSAHLDDSKRSDAPKLAPRVGLVDAVIRLSVSAEDDCKTLCIPHEEPLQFVLSEATRHPILFEALFTSLPLVFHANVLLLSWDGAQATVERILSRDKAYPLNDPWNSCLAAYRHATLLPYRTKGPEQMFSSAETRRTLSEYRRLISQIDDFVILLRDHNQAPPNIHQDLNSLVEEAEFALANDDVGTAVARLEAVLSTIHKLILLCAPQGTRSKIVARDAAPAVHLPNDHRRTVLIVEHDPLWSDLLSDLLREADFAVTTAQSSGDALREMVENEFDLVLTDLVLLGFGESGEGADGREVVIAAKRGSEKYPSHPGWS